MQQIQYNQKHNKTKYSNHHEEFWYKTQHQQNYTLTISQHSITLVEEVINTYGYQNTYIILLSRKFSNATHKYGIREMTGFTKIIHGTPTI